MHVTVKKIMLALILALIPAAANAELYTQLNGAGQTTSYEGFTSILSQFDSGIVTPPDLPLLAIAYDNFQLQIDGIVTIVAWSGAYEDIVGPRATTFQLGLYQNNPGAVPNGPGSALGAGDGPGTLIGSIMTVTSGETALGNNHYLYSADVTGFGNNLLGGTKYWLSVAAVMPFADNGFGWAFSNAPAGNDMSWQYTQDGPIVGGFKTYQTFHDAVDYSFSVTAVPEPSSCLLVAGALGGIAVKKWRKRRQKAIA